MQAALMRLGLRTQRTVPRVRRVAALRVPPEAHAREALVVGAQQAVVVATDEHHVRLGERSGADLCLV